MQKYIAVFEVEDDCNILTIDAEVKYTYETNGTNYELREDIEFKKVEELEEQTRNCKDCIYSKNGKCAGTEECHECMWENKFKSYNEVEDAFKTAGIIIRAKINDLCNQKRFSEAEEIQEAYDKINKHFDNKLIF
jgi:hypothetical protein